MNLDCLRCNNRLTGCKKDRPKGKIEKGKAEEA